jgi:hypothetical protein
MQCEFVIAKCGCKLVLFALVVFNLIHDHKSLEVKKVMRVPFL